MKFIEKNQTELTPKDFFHGQRFVAVMYEIPVSGKITIEDERILLCQNEHEGYSGDDKQGFKYSFLLGYTNDMDKPIHALCGGDFYGIENFKLEKRNDTQIDFWDSLNSINNIKIQPLINFIEKKRLNDKYFIDKKIKNDDPFSFLATQAVYHDIVVYGLSDKDEDWLLSNFTEELSFLEMRENPRELIFRFTDKISSVSKDDIKSQIALRGGKIKETASSMDLRANDVNSIIENLLKRMDSNAPSGDAPILNEGPIIGSNYTNDDGLTDDFSF